MNFRDTLNYYIETVGTSGKELSEHSGLTPSVISRYRSGNREPSIGSSQFAQLIKGLAEIAEEKGKTHITVEILTDTFAGALNSKEEEFEIFHRHFITLLTGLEISMKNLADGINYDMSFLYRIRSGERRPQNIHEMAELIAGYVAGSFSSPDELLKIQKVTGASDDDLKDADSLKKHISEWLVSEEVDYSESVDSFLHKMNDFNLDEFIEAIHLNDIKIPTVPFHFPVSRSYYGIHDMRIGELDFFKATALSKSDAPVFMCADMPMNDMAEDMDFNKKWMMGIAAALRKGLRLNMIHNIDRPFSELMLGFEAWIPMYMTGQISPYYLPDINTDIYHHLLYVSGACALSGECINGYHDHGKYYLTNNKTELDYYNKRSRDLLKKARPLMKIYRKDDIKAFSGFLAGISSVKCDHHHILSQPPLYTMSEELLKDILDSNSISKETGDAVMEFFRLQQEGFDSMGEVAEITDDLHVFDEKTFKERPVRLNADGIFPSEDIVYTYEQYTEHVRLTERAAESHAGYTLNIVEPAFRNISIYIFRDNFVVISKSKTPAIQFVIYHPTMVNALDNLVLITDR